MTESKICTCPSGDDSLAHPCPAHPAVEQAGGDERAAFRPAQVISYRPGVGEVTIYVAGRVPGYMNIGDTVYVSDRAPVEQPSAALAQPSPTLPPFAEKVLAKLRRFYDCAEDFESGGVDIGRHWLDLLTQLGLLNRVQRSPALWEISQQGEDLLGTPHPSPAQAEKAEAERQEVVDFNPYRYHAEKIRQRADGAASAYEAGRSALGYMEDIAESALIVRNGLDELSAQHERITAKLHDALDESDGDRWKMRSERDAANARLHEVATACATAEQERDAALARVSGLRSLLNPILCYVENDIERMRGDRDKSDNKEIYDLAISLAMERLKAAQHAVFTTEPGCDTAVELASHITAQAQHSVPDGYRLIRLEHFAAIKAQLNPEQVDAYRGRNIYDEDKVYANWNACRSALDEIKDVFQQIDWDAENELAELLAAAPGKGEA